MPLDWPIRKEVEMQRVQTGETNESQKREKREENFECVLPKYI
jgi:hypothetical protein